MNDPAIAVMEYLDRFGSRITFNVNVGQFPVSPDESIVINQSGGRSPYPHLAINFPSVQIMVRGRKSGYVVARHQMGEVCDILLGIGPTLLNSDTYQSCNQMGDVISLGQDDNSRPVFSANFWFIVLPSSLGNRRAL